MYFISKLSKDSQNFILALTQNNSSRSHAASISLGRAISSLFSIPAEPVDNIVLYYKQQNELETANIVSAINELIVLDVDTTLDYAVKFYQYRYNAAHPSSFVLALKPDTAVVDFFAITKVFDSSMIKLVEEEHLRVTDMTNKFTKLISEIKAGD